MKKVTLVIGCESCQSTTIAKVTAKTQQEALYKARKKHMENNLHCDEFDLQNQNNVSGLAPIEASLEFFSLPTGNRFVPRKTKGELLLDQILR